MIRFINVKQIVAVGLMVANCATLFYPLTVKNGIEFKMIKKEVVTTTKVEFIKQTTLDMYKKVEEEKARAEAEAKEKWIKDRTFTFKLTFYTDLNSENGFGPINCLGERLAPGMVANNKLPLGTKIDLGAWGIVEVRDRGGKNFNKVNNLDFFIARNKGESDAAYYKRVNNLGIKYAEGVLLID